MTGLYLKPKDHEPQRSPEYTAMFFVCVDIH